MNRISQPPSIFPASLTSPRRVSSGYELGPGRTGRLDLRPKMMVYAKTGMLEYWVVLSTPRTIEVYRLPESAEQPAATLAEGVSLTTPLLPGLALPVAEVFAS